MIRDAVEYVEHLSGRPGKPWLIVGKGPTAVKLLEIDTSRYHVLTLNHACVPALLSCMRPALAHFVDIEAFDDCGDMLADFDIPTCLPWYPHSHCSPSPMPLKMMMDLFGKTGSAPLAWLCGRDRLYSYNASTSKSPPNPKLHRIRLRHFGAVGAFNLLAVAGVKMIDSIGVDGGTEYAPAFDPKDKLANTRTSFDSQFPEIEHTVKKHGIAWRKL